MHDLGRVHVMLAREEFRRQKDCRQKEHEWNFRVQPLRAKT